MDENPLLTPTTTDTAPPPEVSQETPPPMEDGNPNIVAYLKSRAENSRDNRKQRLPAWKRNVEIRLGHPVSGMWGLGVSPGVTDEGDTQSEINPDWYLTKTKTANLFSQVPEVRATHENPQYAAAIAPFTKSLNFEGGEKRAKMGVAMEEVLNDVTNAAGIGGMIVGYAARFAPKVDPQTGQLVQMPTDYKFYASRISPRYLLHESSFLGSDFNDADWVGYDGDCTWAEGMRDFEIPDTEKDHVLGEEEATQSAESLRSQPTESNLGELRRVQFTKIYYWRYRQDPQEPSFTAIWELILVKGWEDHPIHRPWKGQQLDPQTGKYIGCCRFPLQLLTITYITDNPVPPSDSQAGRPQVNDLRRSRSQMFENRERSRPIRWFDSNRVDIEVRDNLLLGTWQGMIPTNGSGDKVIGEIARASYPAEDFSFDRSTQSDLEKSWMIGPNQMGMMNSGERTAKEVETTQSGFNTRISQERGRCASFFLRNMETLAGLMTLYSDFPNLADQERQQMFQAWDMKRILFDLVLKIRPDSTVVLDADQMLQRRQQFLNMTAKSGVVNIEPIIAEMAELSGLDPSLVIKKPQPPTPEPPSLSISFKGAQDLSDPIVLAMLVKNNQAPTPEQLQAAIKLLQAAMTPVMPQPQAVPQLGPGQPPQQQEPYTDHPNMQLVPKVAQRAADVTQGIQG